LSTQFQEHAQLEVDAYNFLAALRDGALDGCLRYVERHCATALPDPLLDCKLAEALLHDGRNADALACVQRGFPEAAGDPALLRICAWVFSKYHRQCAGFRVTDS
jgi:hypothetical protein